jgi:hypothetical protein
LLNAAFAMAILDLISQVHLPSSVNMLPRYLKHFTFSSCLWWPRNCSYIFSEDADRQQNLPLLSKHNPAFKIQHNSRFTPFLCFTIRHCSSHHPTSLTSQAST